MDEKGYVISPLTFLILIPILVIALNYSGIINEANTLATIATGGDVTFTTATNVYGFIQKAAGDAGRNSAYNATRDVIDNNRFLANSKEHIRQNVLNSLNYNVIESCKKLENETGREISINNIPISNYTNQTFYLNDVTITQEDPFGFYVNVRGGIPIKVTQKDQVYEGVTPPISAYVSIQGVEDPYIWINSKQRTSNVIYSFPYYTYSATTGRDYHFDDLIDDDDHLQYLYTCLNGTDNPSTITPRPYYFQDPYGLSFFDRLENKTNTSTTSPQSVRMSTFIIGDPLLENHGRPDISRLDHEYFKVPPVTGTRIEVKNEYMIDPIGSEFYLSTFYMNFFDLSTKYN
ncbi:MAG: hypothetical protein ACP5C3_00170 [Methanomicrobiales archaeon]